MVDDPKNTALEAMLKPLMEMIEDPACRRTEIGLTSQSPEAVRMLARAIDTARARAKAELTSSTAEGELHEAALEMLTSQIPHRVFWKDKDLRYRGANRRFARDAGQSDQSKLIGKRDADLFPESVSLQFRRGEGMLLSGEIPHEHTRSTQEKPDGTSTTVVTSRLPLTNSVGQVIGVLGMYSDVTEVQSLKETVWKLRGEVQAATREAQALRNRLKAEIGRAEKLAELINTGGREDPTILGQIRPPQQPRDSPALRKDLARRLRANRQTERTIV